MNAEMPQSANNIKNEPACGKAIEYVSYMLSRHGLNSSSDLSQLVRSAQAIRDGMQSAVR